MSPIQPRTILDNALRRIEGSTAISVLANSEVSALVEIIARNLQNRAAVRLVLSCALAKACLPAVDIRKPYTEIKGNDSFSGRTFDEQYLSEFINDNHLHAIPRLPI